MERQRLQRRKTFSPWLIQTLQLNSSEIPLSDQSIFLHHKNNKTLQDAKKKKNHNIIIIGTRRALQPYCQLLLKELKQHKGQEELQNLLLRCSPPSVFRHTEPIFFFFFPDTS